MLSSIRRTIRGLGYVASGYWAAVVCQVKGHDVVHSVDYDAGFDTYWCRRCSEGDL